MLMSRHEAIAQYCVAHIGNALAASAWDIDCTALLALVRS